MIRKLYHCDLMSGDLFPSLGLDESEMGSGEAGVHARPFPVECAAAIVALRLDEVL